MLPLGENVTLDPARATDRHSRQVVAALYDTLLDFDLDGPDPHALVPELLVELPEVSEDGLAIDVELRHGDAAARFADDPCFADGRGRIVDVADVEASLDRSPLLAGRISSFERRGEHGLRLLLPRRQPELLPLLANPQSAIVPHECLATYDGEEGRPSLASHPVGSGPFMLDQANSQIGHHLHLIANPNVAPERAPGLSSLDLTVVHAPETALRLFQAGELAVLAPEQGQFAQVVEDGRPVAGAVPEGTTLHHHVVPGVTLLLFRMDDPVVGKDPNLRRAIALAFDAERYHTLVRNGVWAEKAHRVVPPGIDGAAAERLHPFAPDRPDPAAAKAMIASALAAPLRYHTQAGATARNEADLLAAALEPLGLELEIHQDAHYPATLVDPAARPQVFSLLLDADWPSADYFLFEFTCASNLAALTRNCDPEYDALYEQMRAASPPKRRELVDALERRLGETVPVRPIDHPHLYFLVQPFLAPPVWHPLTGLRLERLRLR